MSQEQINIFLAVIGILGSSGTLLYIIQQFFQRRKNKIDYGDNLLDVTNKMSEQLKKAREDLFALQNELQVSEVAHSKDTELMEKQWHERQERLKSRISDLEKSINKYDISFTLTTHPFVNITDLKVVGKEDVLASQKMRAITGEKKK